MGEGWMSAMTGILWLINSLNQTKATYHQEISSMMCEIYQLIASNLQSAWDQVVKISVQNKEMRALLLQTTSTSKFIT